MEPVFEVFVKSHFSAAHRLRDYDGDCARWHGHNWEVTATLQVDTLNQLGIAVDFREVKQALQTILKDLDHSDLTQFAPFAGINPTSEVIARYIFQQLKLTFAGERLCLARVQVCETPSTGAVYFE